MMSLTSQEMIIPWLKTPSPASWLLLATRKLPNQPRCWEWRHVNPLYVIQKSFPHLTFNFAQHKLLPPTGKVTPVFKGCLLLVKCLWNCGPKQRISSLRVAMDYNVRKAWVFSRKVMQRFKESTPNMTWSFSFYKVWFLSPDMGNTYSRKSTRVTGVSLYKWS